MEKKLEKLESKFDIIIYLLLLNIKNNGDFDDKTTKNLVNLLLKSGYTWRDVSSLLNISQNTINKIMKK